MKLAHLVGLGVVVLLAGCSGNDNGSSLGSGLGITTSTTTSHRQASSATEDENAAPKVAKPLDVEGILDDPCDALATNQLSELGLTGRGETNTFGDDDGCDWTLQGTSLSTVIIRPLVSDKNGLGDTYDLKEHKDYFEETRIGGYPAVFASALDERDSGNCTLVVGLTDELAVSVDASFLDIDPCPVAERTAEAMIEHLKDGA